MKTYAIAITVLTVMLGASFANAGGPLKYNSNGYITDNSVPTSLKLAKPKFILDCGDAGRYVLTKLVVQRHPYSSMVPGIDGLMEDFARIYTPDGMIYPSLMEFLGNSDSSCNVEIIK